MAAGFADPAWVPTTVTAWAYSWGDDVEAKALPVRHMFNVRYRARFLRPLLDAINAADMLTGHNILRFDLPVLNGEAAKLGLGPLPARLVSDTIRIGRARVKKGQDVMAHMFGVTDEKLPLNWAEWQAAYSEPTLETVLDRVKGDVVQHMALRAAQRDRGWLRPPTMWRP